MRKLPSPSTFSLPVCPDPPFSRLFFFLSNIPCFLLVFFALCPLLSAGGLSPLLSPHPSLVESTPLPFSLACTNATVIIWCQLQRCISFPSIFLCAFPLFQLPLLANFPLQRVQFKQYVSEVASGESWDRPSSSKEGLPSSESPSVNYSELQNRASSPVKCVPQDAVALPSTSGTGKFRLL